VTRGQLNYGRETESARYRNKKRQIETGERGKREGGRRENQMEKTERGGERGRQRRGEGEREPLFGRPWQRIH